MWKTNGQLPEGWIICAKIGKSIELFLMAGKKSGKLMDWFQMAGEFVAIKKRQTSTKISLKKPEYPRLEAPKWPTGPWKRSNPWLLAKIWRRKLSLPQFNHNSSQLNTWVWHEDDITPPPTTRNSMSSISQLLLTRFWTNFKGRILGSIASIKTKITTITTTTRTTTTTFMGCDTIELNLVVPKDKCTHWF